MDIRVLAEAVHNSGGAPPHADELARVVAKVAVLEQTGRYAGLLGHLAVANDKSNFLATLLEATFAHQWESQGLALAREVRQSADMLTTVDFRRTCAAGNLDMELRLIQQDEATTAQIEEQLKDGYFYGALMDTSDHLKAVCRAQNIILDKVQRRDGTPVKFAPPQAGTLNIVVVDTHDMFLGGMDVNDCRLVAQGDPGVQAELRIGAFGVFEDFQEGQDERFRPIHVRFAHARATAHGIMFLFQADGAGLFDYGLTQYTFWNPRLMDRDMAKAAMAEIQKAIPFNGN